jgi:hypothetical protein
VFGKERCNGLLGVLGGGGERDGLVVRVAVAIADAMVVIVVTKVFVGVVGVVVVCVFVIIVSARSGLLSHGDWRGGSHS